MYYLLTGFAAGIIATVAYNYKQISNYAIKLLEFYPGEGEVFKQRKDYYVRTPEVDIRLNYYKTPSFDINVCYFKTDETLATGKIDRESFVENYGNLKIYRLLNKGLGVIEDVYKTKNLVEGDLYGYISSYTEDDVYVFKIEEGLIDLDLVFEEYLEHF